LPWRYGEGPRGTSREALASFGFVCLGPPSAPFGQAVAAVGFEQGEAGLFELVLLLVALAADVVVLLLQLGRSFAQYGDVVFEAV